MSPGNEMEYLKFYELEIEPFQNDPDGRFYFESASQRRARLWLERGVRQRKGLCVAIGGPGCGKTTLAHYLAESLGERGGCARLLSISHSECADGWLLPHVAQCFGVRQPAPDAPTVIEQIQHELLSALAAERLPVLLVDEAQLLSKAAVMEEFRGLLNLAHGGRKLLSILLFGLPELSSVLKLDEALAQRVEIRCDVSAFEREETLAYVVHRLGRAGGPRDIFTHEALDAIHQLTSGIPRLVNTLADNALFEGSIEGVRPVDVSIVAACAEQLELAPPAESAAPERRPDDARTGAPERPSGSPPAPGAAAAPAPRRAVAAPRVAPARSAPRQRAVPATRPDEDVDALPIELEVAAAEPESVRAAPPAITAARAEPQRQTEGDGEPFDPGELLLEEDDDAGGPREVTRVQAESAEVEVEELDGLFETIQVE